MTKKGSRRIETTYPIQIYLRTLGEPDQDWQPFATGPGYFTIPEGMEAEVSIQNLNDDSIRGLVEELMPVQGLASFNLSENRNVGNKGVRFLPQLEQIAELNLSACGMNDSGLDPLLSMKNLRKLDLSYCTRLTDAGIRKLNSIQFLQNPLAQG